MIYRLCLFFICSLIWVSPALASEAFGLAMHGEAKYSSSDAHLDYANPDAPVGGTITYDAIGTFDTINPYSIKGKAAQGLNLVYDRLMARVWDEPFTMYPLIAERVEVPDDRSSITVHVNPKARFHDGSAITADDVIFSFETLKNEGRPNMRSVYRLVKTVEKLGDMSAKFSFGDGYDQETAMIIAMMPVLSKAYWEGKTFDQTTLDMPVLNGPYKISEIDPGRKVIYERVPDYWAKDLLTSVGHYNFDRVVYEYYRDDTVAFEAFKSGNIDLRREYDAGKWASAYDFPAAKDGRVELEALPHGRPERMRALIFNTRRAPFDDIRVREALNLLLDFDWINKNIFHNQYKRIESFFPNSELAANYGQKKDDARDERPPYNLRQSMRAADALLKDAGWEVVNGKRMKNGQPFKFEILLGAPEDEKIALHFKRALDKMGIEAPLRVLDAAAHRARLNEYDFDMTLYYWLSSLSPGTEQILYWGCEAGKQPARWNFPGICDPEIDELSAQIAQTKTRQDLVDTVRSLDRKLMAGNYVIPLYYGGKDYIGYWKPIAHPEKTPLYGAVLETWWMDGDETANQD